MKLVTYANGTRTIKLSETDWIAFGVQAGWMDKRAFDNPGPSIPQPLNVKPGKPAPSPSSFAKPTPTSPESLNFDLRQQVAKIESALQSMSNSYGMGQDAMHRAMSHVIEAVGNATAATSDKPELNAKFESDYQAVYQARENGNVSEAIRMVKDALKSIATSPAGATENFGTDTSKPMSPVSNPHKPLPPFGGFMPKPIQPSVGNVGTLQAKNVSVNLSKTAAGKQSLKMSRKVWESIGKQTGWAG